MEVVFGAAPSAARRSRWLAVVLLCLSFGSAAVVIMDPPDPPMNSELVPANRWVGDWAAYAAPGLVAGVVIDHIGEADIDSARLPTQLGTGPASETVHVSYIDLIGIGQGPYADPAARVPAVDGCFRYLSPTAYWLDTTPQVLVQMLAPASASQGCGERLQPLNTRPISIGQMLGSTNCTGPRTVVATCHD